MEGNKHSSNEAIFQEIVEELQQGLAWQPGRPVVTMFGSARLPQDHPACLKARELAGRLAKAGWTVLTGGGPGIMEAANGGAYDNGGDSVGLNIALEHEESANAYQTMSLYFRHFSARKAVFVRQSDVFIAHEGGFGTLDEVFDAITQIQTKKRPRTTIVLMGADFWSPLVEWIGREFVKRRLINEQDMHMLKVVDTVDEAEQAVHAAWAMQPLDAPHVI